LAYYDHAVRTEGLTKIFRTGWSAKPVEAVVDLNLEIIPGEVFALLGPNGSGKTTTTKMLLGLLHPTRGKAWVLGRPAGDVAMKERIGYLPEESYLYRFLDAEETLDFYGQLFGLPRRDRRRRADELIKMVGLDQARKRPLKEYSKGMARRIGLAQALINDPDLIILDEPTTGLDPIGTREMKDLIVDLRRRGKTVLLCSHLLADVRDVCDRIAILHVGRLKVVGEVKKLLQVTDVTQITAKEIDEETQHSIQKLLKQHGAEVISVEHPTTSLEDLFLRTIRGARSDGGTPQTN